MDEGAIPPGVPGFSGEVVTDAETPEVTRLEVKDKALAGLFQHPDWPVYEKVVEEEIENLRSLKGLDLSGLSDEELGRKVKQANLAADMVDQLLLRVKEAAKVAFENERQTKSKSTGDGSGTS